MCVDKNRMEVGNKLFMFEEFARDDYLGTSALISDTLNGHCPHCGEKNPAVYWCLPYTYWRHGYDVFMCDVNTEVYSTTAICDTCGNVFNISGYKYFPEKLTGKGKGETFKEGDILFKELNYIKGSGKINEDAKRYFNIVYVHSVKIWESSPIVEELSRTKRTYFIYAEDIINRKQTLVASFDNIKDYMMWCVMYFGVRETNFTPDRTCLKVGLGNDIRADRTYFALKEFLELWVPSVKDVFSYGPFKNNIFVPKAISLSSIDFSELY